MKWIEVEQSRESEIKTCLDLINFKDLSKVGRPDVAFNYLVIRL